MAIGFAHAAEMPDSVDLDSSPTVFHIRGPLAALSLSRELSKVILGWKPAYPYYAL